MAATKLHVLDCGSMSCDLTWLLLKPTGLHEFFPSDRVTEEQYLDARLGQLGVAPENLTYSQVIFGHDADQLWSMRRSPDGYDS